MSQNKLNRKSKIFEFFALLLVFSTALTLISRPCYAESEESQGGKEKEETPVFPQPVADSSLAQRPHSPELIGPEYRAKISGHQANLKWKAVEGATSYHVQVATDPNFKWLKLNEKEFNGTTIDFTPLQAKQNYYWRVFARNSNQNAGYTKSVPAQSSFRAE